VSSSCTSAASSCIGSSVLALLWISCFFSGSSKVCNKAVTTASTALSSPTSSALTSKLSALERTTSGNGASCSCNWDCENESASSNLAAVRFRRRGVAEARQRRAKVRRRGRRHSSVSLQSSSLICDTACPLILTSSSPMRSFISSAHVPFCVLLTTNTPSCSTNFMPRRPVSQYTFTGNQHF